jgi:hypothetical protein
MPRIEIKARWIAADGAAWECTVSSVNFDRVSWQHPDGRERLTEIISDVLDYAAQLESGPLTTLADRVVDPT